MLGVFERRLVSRANRMAGLDGISGGSRSARLRRGFDAALLRLCAIIKVIRKAQVFVLLKGTFTSHDWRTVCVVFGFWTVEIYNSPFDTI